MSILNTTPSCETCGVSFSPPGEVVGIQNNSGHKNCLSPEFVYSVNGFRILCCPRCRLLWTDVPQNFQAGKLYEEEFFQGKSPNGYFDYLGTAQLLNNEFIQRARLVHKYQSAGRLLDVGCATGNFIKAARQYFDVKGIDISSFAVEAAIQDGLPAACGTLEELEKTPQSYDIITMFDTLEHVPNPQATLQQSHSLLKKDGIVVISTGDASSVLAKLAGKRWRLMTPPEHLWFFSRRNLGILLERTGFSVLDCVYPWRQVPVSLMWFQIFRGRQKPLPDWIGKMTFPVNLFDAITVVAKKMDV